MGRQNGEMSGRGASILAGPTFPKATRHPGRLVFSSRAVWYQGHGKDESTKCNPDNAVDMQRDRSWVSRVGQERRPGSWRCAHNSLSSWKRFPSEGGHQFALICGHGISFPHPYSVWAVSTDTRYGFGRFEGRHPRRWMLTSHLCVLPVPPQPAHWCLCICLKGLI